ncbi:MAG: AAA family ATPase [Candidatus Altiarchaeota archaeon]|nr:AAA family ATPase [Candidatus Altiarchaeota archaeon]
MVEPVKRFKTGIPGLDDLIEGGFPEGSSILISGTPGTGKTTLGIQFIYNGAKEYNDNGLIITVEENKDQIIRNMGRYGFDLEKMVDADKITIVEEPVLFERIVTHETIEEIIKKKNIKRVVFDSLTLFKHVYPDEEKRRREILRFIETFRNMKCTCLFTMERPSSGLDHYFPEEFFMDGLIIMGQLIMSKKTKTTRILGVIKLRGTKHPNHFYPMRFDDKGVVIYSEEEIFEV